MSDGPEQGPLDETVWEQLDDSLNCAEKVIAALEVDIQPFMVSEFSKSTKLKVKATWNMQELRDHEDRLRSQIS